MGLNRKVLLTALGLAFGAVSTQISADVVTEGFDVTIKIVASCKIDVEDLDSTLIFEFCATRPWFLQPKRQTAKH